MPAETPSFKKTLLEESEALADSWAKAASQQESKLDDPEVAKFQAWTSPQKVQFRSVSARWFQWGHSVVFRARSFFFVVPSHARKRVFIFAPRVDVTSLHRGHARFIFTLWPCLCGSRRKNSPSAVAVLWTYVGTCSDRNEHRRWNLVTLALAFVSWSSSRFSASPFRSVASPVVGAVVLTAVVCSVSLMPTVGGFRGSQV